ncbi:MAG: aminotransferase class IV [Chitinophagaceae bacterium]|nr:aminotransferase class IV [Chitinophagaceae bacterium]
MEYFNYNGKTFKEQTAVLQASSRGLRFGDGLFETMKSIHGRLQFTDEHFARLWHGMQVLQFNIPGILQPDSLKEEILNLIAKERPSANGADQYRLFRGNGGLYDAVNHTPNYVIQTWPLPEESGAWNSNGLVLGIYGDVKKSCDVLSNLKHNNFLPYVMAAMHAKNEKWNDAVLLNTSGRICDSTIANIFIIKDDLVSTPALAEGCIAGIMRKNMIQQLAKINQHVFETELTVDDLLAADEVF